MLDMKIIPKGFLGLSVKRQEIMAKAPRQEYLRTLRV